MNRTMPGGSVRFMNHLIAKASHLLDNGRDKRVEPFADGARPGHRQIDDIRDQAEERHRRGVAVDETRSIKQICDAHLVGR